MLIRDLFEKEITRSIKGVIKVGQNDDANIKQELEEYVVTKELQKHFAEFFANYRAAIQMPTDKIGVWISGFFGSGKSHFLKILSYLLENRDISGKKAIDYFIEDEKITNATVLGDMKVSISIPTDVILFNIDSKSNKNGQKSKNAIVLVFLKVFNEMQGLSSNLYIADLERRLIHDEKYEEFQHTFKDINGSDWKKSYDNFYFIQDDLVDTLSQMNYMSETAARNWCEKTITPYEISIEDFAKMVKYYLSTKEKNHHIVFLADEVGQYIGDDSQLMVNLQTVVEDLGRVCMGQVWVIVTSQQDIDSVTKDISLRSNDFSKIQGRFDTRLSLSSANVDDVIKKRILDKKEIAKQTLDVLYEQKETIIKNLIVFNDGIEKKLYLHSSDFIDVYPFIPYQFNLLGDVLTSIRTHGATGKHLSEGERSMISFFQESAVAIKDESTGVLAPFNLFYDALHKFLDHSHRGVIAKAYENEYINPEHQEDCFAVNVLKTLFMIKYVDQVKANVDNITSLMVSHIDMDRMELKKNVQDALKALTSQMLVQKNGDTYVFQTNEEQEINREIDSQHIELSETINKTSELIFQSIFSENRYKYNERYSFPFNQMIDEYAYKGNQNNDITVRILTPTTDINQEDTSLRLRSGQQNEVIVLLPEDSTFMQEIQMSLKIEKFLRSDKAYTLSNISDIKNKKTDEKAEHENYAKQYLETALSEATIYVNGDVLDSKSKTPSSRINDALEKTVKSVYHKLTYMDTPKNEVALRELFAETAQQNLSLDPENLPNHLALQEALQYISMNTKAHAKTSMKSVMTRFTKAPYGFLEDDIKWLVAKLYIDGDIALFINGAPISTQTKEEIIRYITKKEFLEKLLLDRREKATEKQKKVVKDISIELFGSSSFSEDDDQIIEEFKNKGKNIVSDLDKYETILKMKPFPGKQVVATGQSLLRKIIHTSNLEFFQELQSKQDDLLDFAEDYEPVKTFFSGQQKDIFENAIRQMAIYENSKNFIVSEELEAVTNKIQEILHKSAPYKDIPDLPELIEKFQQIYSSILDARLEPVLQEIEVAQDKVLGEIEHKIYRDELFARYKQSFQDLKVKANSCADVAVLQNISLEADSLKIRFLSEMEKKDYQIAELEHQKQKELEQDTNSATNTTVNHVQPKIKKRKSVSIKTLNTASTWQIESEDDVDAYLQQLRNNLIKSLEEDTIVNIEF